MPRSVVLLFVVLVSGCGPALDARSRAIAAALVAADGPLLRDRPALVAGKYNRMARTAYEYYRGSVPVYRLDVRDPRSPVRPTRFVADALPWSSGDAHPENFGVLVASDGSLALEPNDLDAADRYPYGWDLRRLTTGMVLAARASNADDPTAHAVAVAAERAIAHATARAYADTIVAAADGAPPGRVTSGGAVVSDLLSRAARDLASRDDLALRTTVAGGARRLLRGVLEADDPEHTQAELPAEVMTSLAALLASARSTMPVPPPAEALALIDAVRELGSGVASWPRVRVIALVRGLTDDPADDVLLQVKEISDSGASTRLPPTRWEDDVPARVLAARALWARPDADPHFTAGSWLGLPVLVRTESEAHKTVRVGRLEGELGTVDALVELGETLGALLARMHATDVDGVASAPAIAAVLRGHEVEMADDEAALAVAAADAVETDLEAFRDALRALGPTLGVRRSASLASPDLLALLGTPPPVVPFE